MPITAARLVADIDADTSGLQAGMAQAESQVDSFSGRMQKTGRNLRQTGMTMTRTVTAPIVGIGAASLMVAGQFEKSMNQVRAVTGATGGQMEELEGLARELGATTQFSASQAADAMYFLASAGFDTVETMEALPGVLQLASAAQMDLAEASDVATNILSGYGMEAEELGRVNDTLVATFQATNTNVQQLGEAFQYAGPVASGAGIAFEEASAAIGLMGNAGIQASMAGTSLRGAITRLLNPTGAAKKTLSALGVSAQTADGKLRPLEDIVGQLEDSGASTADMMQIFGQRAGPAMAALVQQGSDALGDLTGELEGSAGVAEEVADVQMEGLIGAFRELKSAAEEVALTVADTGLLEKTTNLAKSFADLLRSTAEANPKVIETGVVIAGLAASIGPALWILGAMVGAIGNLAPLLGTLAGLFAGVSAPVWVTVAAVAGLGVALWKLTDGFAGVREFVRKVWPQVQQTIEVALLAIRVGVKRVTDLVTSWWEDHGEDITAFTDRTWGQVQDIVGSVLDAVDSTIGTWIRSVQRLWDRHGAEIMAATRMVLGVVSKLWNTTWANLTRFLSGVWSGIKNIVGGGLKAIEGLIEFFTGVFTGDFRKMGRGAIKILQGTWETIKGIFKTALRIVEFVVRQAFVAVETTIRTFAGDIRTRLSDTWAAVVRGVAGFVADVVEWFRRRLPNRVLSRLSIFHGQVTGKFAQVWAGVKRGVRNFLDDVVEFFRKLPARIGKALKGLAKEVKDAFSFDLPALNVPLGGGLTAQLDGPGVGGQPSGWQSMYGAIQQAFPGTPLISGFRPGAITSTGNQSYHALGRAVDLPPSMAIFEWIRRNFGSRTKELIYTPAGGRQIHNGQPTVYSGITAAEHWDHVHWAMDQGGYLPEGLSLIANRTGSPEPVLSPDQWRTMHRAATSRGVDEKTVRRIVREVASEFSGGDVNQFYGVREDEIMARLERRDRMKAVR